MIGGREAIPVRAIPLLTDWNVMWPDAVAKVLAWDEFYFNFEGLCAYRIEESEVKPIKATWWRGFAVRDLKALSDRIKAGQVTHDAGHQKWRKESLAELPAGVFVWKDEYVPMYQWQYGPDALARSLGRELTQSERQERELNFDPFMRPELYSLVMGGFEFSAIKAKEPTAEESAENIEASTARKNRLDEMLKTHLEQLSDPIYQREDKRIDGLLIKWKDALELLAEWKNSDPRGIPSEIECKKVGLDVAMRQYEALDAQVKIERGDGEPENTCTRPQEITPSPAPAPEAAPVVAASATRGMGYAAQYAQDFEDRQLARILALLPNTAADAIKTPEEREADALIKIRSDRIEREAGERAGRAYALAYQRGIDSVTPAATSPAPVAEASAPGGVEADKDGPVTAATRKKRRGWRDITWPYLLEVFQSGNYSTGKDFYKALERKVGNGSPFVLIQGSLFIPQISQTLSLKTVQNVVWKELRESRQTR